MSNWDFHWLRGWDEIGEPAFSARWQALAGSAHEINVFQEPVMVRIWLATKGRALGIRPAFCMAESDGGATVIVPFCLWPHGLRNTWQRRVVPAGEPHFDYQDPLGAAADGTTVDWCGFWQGLEFEVRKKVRWFDLAAVLRMSASVAPSNSRSDAAERSPRVVLDKHASLDDLLVSRSQNHRTDVRRRMRRISDLGNVRLRVLDNEDVKEASDELGRMVTAYARLHAGEGSQDLFGRPGTMAFYEEMVRALLPLGYLHFSVLLADDKPISWHFGFLHRGVLHWYKPTYSVESRDYSPGKVHLAMLVEEGIRRGWRLLDFGAGVEEYKSRWTDDSVPLRRIEWRTATVRSAVCGAIRRAAGLRR